MRSFFPLLLFISFQSIGQVSSYEDSILQLRKDYISDHEAVPSEYDRQHYFRFFKPDRRYRVEARFARVADSVGFEMATYSNKKKGFLTYGYADFRLRGKTCRLYLYQNRKLMQDPKYKDDLFVPFTDKTSGRESYVCRYLDLKIADMLREFGLVENEHRTRQAVRGIKKALKLDGGE